MEKNSNSVRVFWGKLSAFCLHLIFPNSNLIFPNSRNTNCCQFLMRPFNYIYKSFLFSLSLTPSLQIDGISHTHPYIHVTKYLSVSCVSLTSLFAPMVGTRH